MKHIKKLNLLILAVFLCMSQISSANLVSIYFSPKLKKTMIVRYTIEALYKNGHSMYLRQGMQPARPKRNTEKTVFIDMKNILKLTIKVSAFPEQNYSAFNLPSMPPTAHFMCEDTITFMNPSRDLSIQAIIDNHNVTLTKSVCTRCNIL